MAGGFYRTNVKEYIGASVHRRNETEPLFGIVPFNHASRHSEFSIRTLTASDPC